MREEIEKLQEIGLSYTEVSKRVGVVHSIGVNQRSEIKKREEYKRQYEKNEIYLEMKRLVEECAYEGFYGFDCDCCRCRAKSKCVDFWDSCVASLGFPSYQQYSLEELKEKFGKIKESKYSKKRRKF